MFAGLLTIAMHVPHPCPCMTSSSLCSQLQALVDMLESEDGSTRCQTLQALYYYAADKLQHQVCAIAIPLPPCAKPQPLQQQEYEASPF